MSSTSIYLKDILHLVSQNILVPVMILLCFLVAYSIFSIGSLLVELITERRHFKVVVSDFVNKINDASPSQAAEVIKASGLLKDQKKALLVIAENMTLPSEDLFALAKAELTTEDETYRRIVGRNEMVAKIGPMCGLLGTLIPLGPGIVAMGQGDVNTLSSSLLIAFDTTVAGLASAVVCMLIAKCRKRWYANYMMALETGVRCILQKAENVAKIEGPVDSDESVLSAGKSVLVHAQTDAMGVARGKRHRRAREQAAASVQSEQPAAVSSPASQEA